MVGKVSPITYQVNISPYNQVGKVIPHQVGKVSPSTHNQVKVSQMNPII